MALNFENMARGALWLCMAAACVIVPLEYWKHQANTLSAEQEEKKLAELRQAEEKRGPQRLSLKSMGPFMSGIDHSESTGRAYFTNATPRTGVLCIYATAQNPTTRKKTDSLSTCRVFKAYESDVIMEVHFGSNPLRALCRDVDCSLAFGDTPELEQVMAAR